VNRIRSDHTREPGEGRLWLQSRLKPTVRYRPKDARLLSVGPVGRLSAPNPDVHDQSRTDWKRPHFL